MKKREEAQLRFPLILASNSPRRREILRLAGIPFTLAPSDVAEGPVRAGESPSAYAQRLARAKADFIGRRAPSDAVILAADTVVCVGRSILGKPRSRQEARNMLRRLSGRSHWVITGVVVQDRRTGKALAWSEKTRVTFRPLKEKEIQAYLETGEPFDKAGAYAAQGRAAKFILRIEGCFFNVVGLPVARVCQELERISRQRAAAERIRRSKKNRRK